MAPIDERVGNIFTTKYSTVVITVNCVGVMGAGIALEAKLRWPEMAEAYAARCEGRGLKPGDLMMWRKSSPWLMLFPTKVHWRYPSKLEYIEAGLAKLASTFRQEGITSLALPHLGTTHGGLDWTLVRSRVDHYLAPLNGLDVEVWEFDPAAPDPWLDRLRSEFEQATPEQALQVLGVGEAQARHLLRALVSGRVRGLSDLHSAPGIGEKTLDAVYGYLFRRPPAPMQERLDLGE